MDEQMTPNDSIARQLYQNILQDEINNTHTQQLDDRDMAKKIVSHCKKAAKFDLDHNY